MSSELDASNVERKGFSRRSFLQTSGGVATGIAVTVLPSGVVALASPAAAGAKAHPLGESVEPSGDVPESPVMAYVHDAEKGVVTVVSGSGEKTYRDPALVKRLLDAAPSHKG